jgi:2-polyprenyl-3-methyl-5-hydroxy-6-metoxy-1,4-benzoquinol methylase
MIEVNCNLCGSNDWRVLFPATSRLGAGFDASTFRCTNSGYGSHAQIVRCSRCGHVYANPRWSPEELLLAYGDVVDDLYDSERVGREMTFRQHLKMIERLTGPGEGRRLLDVGAYIGVFVEVAGAAAWNAQGIEPSGWAVSIAKERGLNVRHGIQEDLGAEAGTFDVVTMWDVIEHVHDPAGEIRGARALLKPGGLLVIHTMDVDSVFAKVSGSRWPWLMDMHLNYFSRRSLSRLVEREGMRPVWAHTCGRYVRVEYLVTRIEALARPLGRVLRSAAQATGLSAKAVPVNLGDLFTLYARAPETTGDGASSRVPTGIA